MGVVLPLCGGTDSALEMRCYRRRKSMRLLRRDGGLVLTVAFVRGPGPVEKSLTLGVVAFGLGPL